MQTAREAAFLALQEVFGKKGRIKESLEKWKISSDPSDSEFRLAYQIAHGACRRALTLDAFASLLTETGKLKLKLIEKNLLRTALYQIYYLEKVPSHAVVDETVKLAKKYRMEGKIGFFNALLRKATLHKPKLPLKDSIRYSYPEGFIRSLKKSYDKEVVLNILETGNHVAPLMARVRYGSREEPLLSTQPNFVLLEHPSTDPQLYIQNITPAKLIYSLAEYLQQPPRDILDLCASPGGKLLLIHDLFPEAALYANDVSPDKIKRIEENITKYNFKAHLTEGRGEDYKSEKKFDLIVLDVPCSNSGVLNKRVEARWRLTASLEAELKKIQTALFEKALTLLKPEGILWYMTCSVLPEENEGFIQTMKKRKPFEVLFEKLQLPSREGYDGGYAAAIKRFLK